MNQDSSFDPVSSVTFDLSEFHQDLEGWFTEHGRSFPWRTTTNAFHILMAEMMLRRTQARQVVPVYHIFVESYPDPVTLASAPPDKVARDLYSLGLAWRVPAFQQLATVLVETYHGKVPDSYDALMGLPGVGDYVASAVCCFAYSQPHILADTNTVRVAGRIVGIPTHAESRRRKPVRQVLVNLLDTRDPRRYNYALLDLAALVCVPADPKCTICPLVHYCVTGQSRLNPPPENIQVHK